MISFEEFLLVLKSRLTKIELEAAVIYVIEKTIAAHKKLSFPGVVIVPEREAWLAFIDQDPMANWGHPARYFLVMDGRESKSYEARLPPFSQQNDLKWSIVYKAPGVPVNATYGFMTARITIN